jgi:glycosyltransferase involved in cell wall biosynthesis
MTRFSLIVPTIHRTAELERLLASLQRQREDFEVLIIDQNHDDRLTPILGRFADTLKLVHLTSARGASRGRNAGLDAARGDIVAFPDDDAWYPPGLLTAVNEAFASDPEVAGISARGADAQGRDSGIRWLGRPARINRYNVWRTSIEFSIFLRAHAISGLRFNEEIGPGSGTEWGAGEGTDFLLHLIDRGYKLHYEPRLTVHHPSHLSPPPPEEKTIAYARGAGRVIGLHGYPLPLAAVLCLKPLARSAARLARLDFKGAALSRKIALSRFAGYRMTTPHDSGA